MPFRDAPTLITEKGLQMIARRSNRSRIGTNCGVRLVGKAVVDKTIIDSLIRKKVASLKDCRSVEALPVAPCDNGPGGCNWIVPGWVGERSAVEKCKQRIEHYIGFLADQFNIADELRPAAKRDGKP